MPKIKKKKADIETADYRHEGTTRKNIPTASLAAEGQVPYAAKVRYAYSPHLPSVLRFDPTGAPDRLPGLIAEGGRRPLTAEEQRLLAEALRTQEPWLEWAGKRESDLVSEGGGWFDVDPVALHIHERISAQAILKVAARDDVQRDLFGDPQQAYREAVQFYQHDVDWTNRLILGDSLQAMSSLARREDLAGKVQMIYIDPPYGIKFASNFQPEVGNRDVKDKQEDLTREPEMVKAYRDTWHLGIHSYLSYLRDRLIVAKELLADTGSIFVQISDENVHRVKSLLDELYGASNFFSMIVTKKLSPLGTRGIANVADYVLWYAKDKDVVKFNPIFVHKTPGRESRYDYVALPTGAHRKLTSDELDRIETLPTDWRYFAAGGLLSAGATPTCIYDYEFEGQTVRASGKGWSWKTNREGMRRLEKAERLMLAGKLLYLVAYYHDNPVMPLNSIWTDSGSASTSYEKVYVVQTPSRQVQKCMLMSTDPGDLVLDPTCGSGTTAYVAEQWGRRWITIDTSRVAIAVARQRLLTARYDYFKTRTADGQTNGNPGVGFVYKTVPHITLKSIAQNNQLDPIFAKHESGLDERLRMANLALVGVQAEIRSKLQGKLLEKQKAEGKKAVSDADRRRWELPITGKWEHWEVPFDTDPDWPQVLQEAVTAYRQAWRAKMDEVNGCIAANAEREDLVDKPDVVKGIVRVSGPFTVEAVQPPELSLHEAGAFGGAPDTLGVSFGAGPAEAQSVKAYLHQMMRLLKMDGVRFPDNKQLHWSRLEPLFESGGADEIHAEGRWASKGESDSEPNGAATIGVVFGPQYGPVTALMVEEVIRPAARRYEHLVIAGFSFDGAAHAIIEQNPHPRLKLHMVHIRPDVNPAMNGLLKEQPGSQLFTVFGQPRIRVNGPNGDGEYHVEMQGVDIYDPVTNAILPTNAEKVAAWFLDSDYDGRTFCVTQAFFPDKSAWEKLAKALNGIIEPETFETFSGTESLPFPADEHKRIAVKVIDPRGNEVMVTRRLGE